MGQHQLDNSAPRMSIHRYHFFWGREDHFPQEFEPTSIWSQMHSSRFFPKWDQLWTKYQSWEDQWRLVTRLWLLSAVSRLFLPTLGGWSELKGVGFLSILFGRWRCPTYQHLLGSWRKCTPQRPPCDFLVIPVQRHQGDYLIWRAGAIPIYNSIHKQPRLEWGEVPMCQHEFHNYPCIQDPPYIHAYLPTYRQTDRQTTDRQTNRQTHGRTDRQTDGQTARQPHSQPGRKAGRQTGDMHDMRDMHEILTYWHTDIHTDMHLSIHPSVHPSIHPSIQTDRPTDRQTYICAHICIHSNIYHVQTHQLYIYIYIYTHTYMHNYTHTHTYIYI